MDGGLILPYLLIEDYKEDGDDWRFVASAHDVCSLPWIPNSSIT